MTRIIAIHSFRGGTGKSNTTANVAALLAAEGRRVGVIDTDIQSPGIHTLFGLHGETIGHSLNDYLWGKCSIQQTAHPVLEGTVSGQIFLVPSSVRADAIVKVLRQGYDMQLLTTAFRELIDTLKLDALLIYTHPGRNEETLCALAIANARAPVLRPDQQDYEGAGVALGVARALDVPRTRLVVNKAPADYDLAAIKTHVEQTFDCPVAAVLPHSDEMMKLASSDIFALRYPDHPMTVALRELAAQLSA